MAADVLNLETVGEMSKNVSTTETDTNDCEIILKSESEEIKESTLDKLATKLLKHNFILTALELHTELVESGRELPRLRDYFSNPGNFEKHISENEFLPSLPRTSSVQTFDSLDFTRYSDDGERQMDERVAVLEFELRKAKETIKALRTNLTVATESDPNTPTSNSFQSVSPEALKPHEKRALNFLLNEYLLYNSYKLTSITFSDENDDQDFEDWDDVGLNVPKPPNLLQLYRNYSRYIYLQNEMNPRGTQTEDKLHLTLVPDSCTFESCKTEKQHQMEQIAKLEQEQKDISRLSVDKENLEIRVKSLECELKMLKSTLQVNSSLLDDKKSIDSSDTQEYVIVQKQTDSPPNGESTDSSLLQLTTNRSLPYEFQQNLLCLCQTQKIAHENRLIGEIGDIVNSQDGLVILLAKSLPHIVPNILLAKREELIPLILCGIALHPDAKERDKLLNILFNLIKRPDEEQRHMILTGLVAIAQHLGPSRVEAELLPQCWEQITHRYVERRLLVAESCGVLASYVMSEIRSSLLLSMLQQMLQEEKDDVVRETVVRNLALLLLSVDDQDKFTKCCELLLVTLEDSMGECSLHVLLPSVAIWSLELGNLHSHLLPAVMTVLHKHFKVLNEVPVAAVSGSIQLEEQHCILLSKVLSSLLSFLFISVIKSGPYLEESNPTRDSHSEVNVDRLPVFASVVLHPAVILGDEDQLLHLVKSFDQYISTEWYKPWDEHDFIVKELLCLVHNLFACVNAQRQMVVHALVEMMSTLCHLLGRSFTQKHIKPSFLSRLLLDNTDVCGNRITYQEATVPVYVAGVLAVFHQSEELLEFLQDLLCSVSLHNLPDNCIKAAIIELSSKKSYHELLLSVLWDGVVHNSPLVRVTAGRLLEILVGVVTENLLRTRVSPALVTLASDPEIVVRIATVPAFGAILELSSQKDLLEKAHMQFQTFLDDECYRDQHLLYVEVIRTFAKIGPNTEPKFRDEFVLPRLAALAAENNSTTNETKKMDIALALLEAYNAMSCCFMSEQLITEAFLPGLRCLKSDLQVVAPEHEESVNSMMQEFEAKIDLNRDSRPRSLNVTSPGSMEDMKNRVTKMFTHRPPVSRPNLPNLFQLRRK